MKPFRIPVAILVCSIAVSSSQSQTTKNAASTGSPGSLQSAIDQASKAQCDEALPILLKQAPHASDKQLKYRALMATVRCSMGKKDDQMTVNALFDLRRDFPEDPQVLYMSSQIFLELAERSSQELTVVAPHSYQSLELQAETLESQEKWSEAAVIYRKILQENPNLRGIHYRLGRGVLSQPESPTTAEEAKKEFEQELAIDPMNAAAEFWLGEIARLAGQWEQAVAHFSAAVKIDPHFRDGFLSLGTALNSAGRYSEAIPQLEQFVKMAPKDLTGHYQLSIAYARAGRKEDSLREAALHRQLYEKQRDAANARANVAPN